MVCLAIANPRPVPPPSAGAICLVEAFEDARLLLSGDADAGVGDRNNDTVMYGTGRHSDVTAGGSKFDGIVDQVDDHLAHAVSICQDPRKIGRQDDSQRQLDSFCLGAQPFHGGFDQQRSVGREKPQGRLA